MNMSKVTGKKTSRYFLFLLFLLFAGIPCRSIPALSADRRFWVRAMSVSITAGYFILLGKSLYSQIFFNHQPTLAFISTFIQWVSQPKDLYHLVLYHRVFMILYSFGMAVFLIWRFRLRAMLFYFFMKGRNTTCTDINLSGGAYRFTRLYILSEYCGNPSNLNEYPE